MYLVFDSALHDNTVAYQFKKMTLEIRRLAMYTTRRTLLIWLAASVPTTFISRVWAAGKDNIRHILLVVTDRSMSISVSVDQPRSRLRLSVGDNKLLGSKMESNGKFWSFSAENLSPSTNYTLQLADEGSELGESWQLRTFPDRNSEPESFRLLAFTCAGGPDGLGTSSPQMFEPHTFC